MLHAFVYKNLEKLFRENKSSPLLKTPEKDFLLSGVFPRDSPDPEIESFLHKSCDSRIVQFITGTILVENAIYS